MSDFTSNEILERRGADLKTCQIVRHVQAWRHSRACLESFWLSENQEQNPVPWSCRLYCSSSHLAVQVRCLSVHIAFLTSGSFGQRLGRPPVLSLAQIAHAKTVIETKRETVSGMAEILGVNRSTLQRAMNRDVGACV